VLPRPTDRDRIRHGAIVPATAGERTDVRCAMRPKSRPWG
jgi:hypothetical protein